MSNGWTPERRARQAQAIQRRKPWKRSRVRGPLTAVQNPPGMPIVEQRDRRSVSSLV